MTCKVCGASIVEHKPGMHDHAYAGDDPDADIRLERPREAAEPEPCYVCGNPASDAVNTNRYRWALCISCVELMPLCIVAMRHAASGESGWLKYAQNKLNRALIRAKERK